MEHPHHRIRNSPLLSDEQTYDALSALSAEERESLLRFVRTKLTDGDPLIHRIDAAVEKLSQGLEHLKGEVLADLKATEIAAWRTLETMKEAAGRESVRMTEEYRSGRVSRMEQLLSLGSVGPNEWSALQEEFRDAHEQDPELHAWVYFNETPVPAGRGSLQFRELANRAAWALARRIGDDAWKLWLDLLVVYLLKNDPEEEYLLKMQVGHLDRPEGTTYETHPGVITHGENYRIDHLSKASELCCAWLKLYAWKQPPASGRDQGASGTMPVLGSPPAPRTSATNRSVRMRADAEAANPLLAAMRRRGLNPPQLALLVQAEIKRRRVTKLKVDRTTIYRLVNGKTRHPNPIIRSAVLAVLKLPLE